MSKRDWQRHEVNKTLACVIGEVTRQITVYNMSSGGCMAKIGLLTIDPNVLIEIDLEGFATAYGQVVWQAEGYIGLRFDPPIHDAVVRYLGLSKLRKKFEDFRPRDQFGRPIILPNRN